MPDFGIGEAIAGLIGGGDFLGGLFGGGEALGALGGAEGAGLGAAEAGAGLSAEETALALGGGGFDALGGGTALTVNALPGAAAAGGAGGLDIGGLLGGVGSAIGSGASALGNAFIPGASAATPGAGVSSNLPGAGGGAVTDPVAQGGFPTAGQGGQGASAFAPAPGVQLPGGLAPDATSAAAFGDPTFADRALPAEQAGQSGIFSGFETPDSPVGAGAGAADFSAAPPGTVNPGFPSAGTPTASPNLGDFATAPGGTAAPGGSPGAGGFDVSGNPIDPVTGSSNPQYTGGGTTPQYDPTGAGTATNAGAAAPGSTNILGKLGQGAVDSITKNPLGIALGAGGLGLSLASAKAQSQAIKNLQGQASKQSGTADQLANYALTGTVPPGSQAGIDQAIAEAKANAVSNAAGQGLPTDPTKNTALAATLAKIDAQGPILAAQIGQQLLSSGASYAGLSDQLYTQLAQIDQSQRASMGKAIANFAASLNTGGGTKIQIGGTSA